MLLHIRRKNFLIEKYDLSCDEVRQTEPKLLPVQDVVQTKFLFPWFPSDESHGKINLINEAADAEARDGPILQLIVFNKMGQTISWQGNNFFV